LDFGEEGKVEDVMRWQEDEDVHEHPGDAGSRKKKKKKRGGKVEEERKETDQEFLIKCVCSSPFISHTESNK
jgi:hypothetical protein